MYESKIKDKYIHHTKKRFCQGDILRGIKYFFGITSEKGSLSKDVDIPYSIVMNQDCDLLADHRRDERNKDKGSQSIPSILLCPAYQAGLFFKGEHLDGWDIKQKFQKEQLKIKRNEEYKRLHHLQGNSALGVPELVIDFKHFYTVPRDVLYKQRDELYIVTVCELYREELSQRFSNYLSRIGLPDAVQ